MEDFDSFDVASACSDAKLMAVIDGCRPRFQTFEDFQKEQVAHYAREAKEAKEATAAKAKAETSLEMFRRISQARDAKTVKAAASAAKKLVKQKKTKRLPRYYAKKYCNLFQFKKHITVLSFPPSDITVCRCRIGLRLTYPLELNMFHRIRKL